MSDTTWTVISPDMWGHVHADCEADCPCGGPEADTCDECHEWENDRHKVGTFEAPSDADDALLVWHLFEAGFLSDEGRKVATVDDYSDGTEVDILDDMGRKLYVLRREEHDMTCGTCERTWSSVTNPAPAARCPFENEHESEES